MMYVWSHLQVVSGMHCCGIPCHLNNEIIASHCLPFQVLKEIEAMEQNIAEQKEAVGAKEPPMMLAQTRLGYRSQRPNVELVRDPVQYGLVEEVGQIHSSVEQLLARLADSESALKGLIRNQLTLEEDIDIKTTSLHIDREQCMALRMQLESSS